MEIVRDFDLNKVFDWLSTESKLEIMKLFVKLIEKEEMLDESPISVDSTEIS